MDDIEYDYPYTFKYRGEILSNDLESFHRLIIAVRVFLLVESSIHWMTMNPNQEIVELTHDDLVKFNKFFKSLRRDSKS